MFRPSLPADFHHGLLGTLADPDSAKLNNVVTVSLVTNRAPFGKTLTTNPNIDLITQSDLSTCGACVYVVVHADLTNPRNVTFREFGPIYVATSGTLDVTQVPTFPLGATSRVSGSVANVTFVHMNYDPLTEQTTPAADGCKFTVDAITFDSLVTAN
jgi:hypothetical protein